SCLRRSTRLARRSSCCSWPASVSRSTQQIRTPCSSCVLPTTCGDAYSPSSTAPSTAWRRSAGSSRAGWPRPGGPSSRSRLRARGPFGCAERACRNCRACAQNRPESALKPPFYVRLTPPPTNSDLCGDNEPVDKRGLIVTLLACTAVLAAPALAGQLLPKSVSSYLLGPKLIRGEL